VAEAETVNEGAKLGSLLVSVLGEMLKPVSTGAVVSEGPVTVSDGTVQPD